MKKIVMLDILVPEGDFCWDGKIVCDHFDNEGRHGECDLNMRPVNNKNCSYSKPKRCKDLKDM